jgi:hypothetical protein
LRGKRGVFGFLLRGFGAEETASVSFATTQDLA